MSRKEELQQRFNRAEQLKRSSLPSQTRVFQQFIMFMDFKIRNELKPFTIFSLCGSERNKFMVDIYFQKAFSNLSLAEKIQLYQKTIKQAIQIQNIGIERKQSIVDINFQDQSESASIKREPLRFRVQVESGFRGWNSIYLDLDGFKVSSEDMQFDLRNYLIRRSKKTDRECYVLEAIHQSTPEVLRFCFLTNADLKKYLPLFIDLIDRGYKEIIKRMYNIEIKTSTGLRSKSPKSKIRTSPRTKITTFKEQERFQSPEESHIVEEMLKYPDQQNLSNQLNDIISKDNQKYEEMVQKVKESHLKQHPKEVWHKNVFGVMFPAYNLSDLDHFEQFQAVSNQQKGNFIFQNSINPFIFKLQTLIQLPPTLVLSILTNMHLYKNWHPAIVQGDFKLGISSQNSAICYQKHREYSEWYRQRDFLYLRHVFKLDEDYFIADRSIENTNYIPFDTIHRGKIVHQISKISPSHHGCKLIIECYIEYGGLLNRAHICELTFRYLAGFQRMQTYFSKKDYQNKLKTYFNPEWKIRQVTMHESLKQIKSRDRSEVHDSQFVSEVSGIDDDDVFFSIKEDQKDDSERKSVHEIDQADLAARKAQSLHSIPVGIKVNEEGLVILPKDYLKVRHPMTVIESAQRKRVVPAFPDFLKRDVWHLLEDGGLMLINKKMMTAQDSVLSFIMSTLKKNLFSGKGGLNISLPVTIFNFDSNLSRFCLGFSSAPEFLEAAAKLTDPVQRLKLCMIFGITNSLLFVDMQKPFNPILGETFQCFIAGCPVYAQQISHHPPISALLMLGRGYKITASLQATANIHMNSADGINLGWNKVTFDDGQQICFQTPPAEFSGFAIGDRKFQFTKKGYYYDEGNNLYAQMNFEDTAGIFSSKKWKYRDQVDAEVLSVKSAFLHRFLDSFANKKLSPSDSQILERHGKLSGRWPLDIYWDGVKAYNINQNLPYEMVEYQYPLHSNCKYREDLYYRGQGDLSRSQSEKERLENVQRADRKWREKYTGNKH